MIKKSLLFLSIFFAFIFSMKGNFLNEDRILENESDTKVSASDLNLKKSLIKILNSKRASDQQEMKREVASSELLPKAVNTESKSVNNSHGANSIFLEKNFIETFRTNYSKAERLDMLAILKDEIVADQIIINDSFMDKEIKMERESYLQNKLEIYEEMKDIVKSVDGVEIEGIGFDTDSL